MPSLQLHMYRVTAVASRIVDNWKGQNLDKKEIIIACLLHDIGNIIKFKLLGSSEEGIYREVR